jgi:hydrogenase expression/formation protein HypD
VKYIDEFRRPDVAQALVKAIHNTVHKPLRLMEVCGSHTMAIFKHGLKALLPPQMELISGPGCPVCVTTVEDIEWAIRIASQPGVILTSFGDMLKVPGASASLAEIRAQGADVRVVYSPLEALELARENRQKRVVFYGVGFETTAPAVAATVIAARGEGLSNFSLLSLHKLIPPAIAALLSDDASYIDGFLCPGHVSTIIGAEPYRFICEQYHKPAVISGFEPVDILESILRLVRQHESSQPKVEIQYRRAVSSAGNLKAQRLMQQVFKICDSRWRGLGMIPASGLRLKAEFAGFDARKLWGIQLPPLSEPKGCLCGQVLRGAVNPQQCPLFGKRCIPEKPVGPCMVSSEGTCAAYYKYQGKIQ